MNSIAPYIISEGQSRTALDFYQSVFGGEVQQLQTYGQAGFPHDEQYSHYLIHGRLVSGNLVLMMSDTTPDRPHTKGDFISFSLEVEDTEKQTEIFDALSVGGTVIMPLQDTFWGARYGKVIDQYGVTWDLNHTK
ncbi:MAG: VOC family protein [Bacilli bacterium]